VVGIVENGDRVMSPGFKEEGDFLVLLGKNKEEMGGTEYAKALLGSDSGPPPQVDLDEEKRVHGLCLEAIEKGLIASAHDVSEGGLAVAVAECSFFSRDKLGFILILEEDGLSDEAVLFGESQSRIVVTARPQNIKKLRDLARKKNVPAAVIGEVRGKSIVINLKDRTVVDLPVPKAFRAWKEAIPETFRIGQEKR
jgi:phosphoribosylformylglycinamidine synthase